MNSEIKSVVQKIADTLDNAKYAKAVNIKKLYLMLCVKMTEAPMNYDIRLVADLVSRLDRELEASQKRCAKDNCDMLVFAVLGETMCTKHAGVKRRARTAAELGKKQCTIKLKSGPTAGSRCKNAATRDSDYCSRHKTQLKKQLEKQSEKPDVSESEVEHEVVRRKKKVRIEAEASDQSDSEAKELKKKKARKHRKSILKKAKIEEPEEPEEEEKVVAPEENNEQPEEAEQEQAPEVAEVAEEAEEADQQEAAPEEAEEVEEKAAADDDDNMELSDESDNEEIPAPVKLEPEIKLSQSKKPKKKSPVRPKPAEPEDSKMNVNVDAVAAAVAPKSNSACKYTLEDGVKCTSAAVKEGYCMIHSRKTSLKRRASTPQ